MGGLHASERPDRSPGRSAAEQDCEASAARKFAALPKQARCLSQDLLTVLGNRHSTQVSPEYGGDLSANRISRTIPPPIPGQHTQQAGGLSRNPRKFRHSKSSPAKSASRSIILPPLWNV
jgi:hypothetical protein